MNNTKYILSINPSIIDTGFALWERENDYLKNNSNSEKMTTKKNINWKWKPIWLGNWNFKKYEISWFNYNIINLILNILNNNIDKIHLEYIDIYIEREIHNDKLNIAKETLNILRGTILGLFNKVYITKENKKKYLIKPQSWQKWYSEKYKIIWYDEIENKLNYKKWNKKISLNFANTLITNNNWNINIKNNHNIADAILIGWYVVNNKLSN